MKSFKIFFLSLSLLLPALAGAVSQKEMEQARTYAAKSYLRYANDGSGYLDDLNPSTIEELEKGLKPKEKENIKAFKAIPVPTDYKDWDKEKLVEYWAVTAFQNKGLLEKGRGGRIRTRSLINKMTIVEKQPEAPAVSQPESVSSKNANQSPAPSESSTANQSDSLAIDNEMSSIPLDEEDLVLPAEDKAYNYTWVYIMILGILVIVVVALVVYAANVLKKNGNENSRPSGFPVEEQNEDIEHLESVISDKNIEIARLNKKLENLSKTNAELEKKVENLTLELSNLRSAKLKDSRPEQSQEISQEPRKTSLRSIYLGRANARGIFVRADRNLNIGNSVFILETTDGFSGTFRVADSKAAWDLALSNPREYLETACTGHDLDDTAGATRIFTLTPGTAVFEGGCWKVIRKAKIQYE